MTSAPAPAPQVRWRWRLPFPAAVLLAYLAARVVSTIILVRLVPHQVPSSMTGGDGRPVDLPAMLALWDGQWYERIAVQGYPGELPRGFEGDVQQNEWAFYPLFPFLTRAVMGLTRLPFGIAGSAVSLICGAGAALLMAILLRRRIGAVAALAATALWAHMPAALTLQVAYTEALAMLVLTGLLLALERERWLTVAALALTMGLTRPIAVPLSLVVAVAVGWRWRRRRREPIDARLWLRMAAALAACAVAGFVWPLVVWWGTGVRDGYTLTMAAWRASGRVEPFTPWLNNAGWLFGEWGVPVLVVLVVAVLALAVGAWRRGLGPTLTAWSLAYPGYLAAVLDPYTSLFRYLLPLFPWWAVIAGVGGRRQLRFRWVPWLWYASLLALSIWAQWVWGRELWVFVPPSDAPP